MHNLILAIGLLAAFVFFLIDKNLLPGTLIAKRQILDKFEHNRKMDVALRSKLQELVARHNAWLYIAFPDSDITYSEYLDLLDEKAAMEYAESEFSALRLRRLNRRETADYLEKVKGQEDALDALTANLTYQKQLFGQIALMTAS